MANTPNIGWLFYKDYYDVLGSLTKIDNETLQRLSFEEKNQRIYQQKITDQETALLELPLQQDAFSFTLQTQYPGLMSGTGLTHSIQHKEEIKLGFSFDYTSGLPYLPASSVKGVLRSYFPGKLLDMATRAEGKQKEGLQKKAAQLKKLLKKALLPRIGLTALDIDQIDLHALEKIIFEGLDINLPEPNLGIYQRDIFFDAFPVSSAFEGTKANDRGRFIGPGVITPHRDRDGNEQRFKNPIPIKFMKILPKVLLLFQFRLLDSTINGITISGFQKRELFRQILLNFGIGAKTNVGYGQMEEVNDNY